jgi:hypothetical protein
MKHFVLKEFFTIESKKLRLGSYDKNRRA